MQDFSNNAASTLATGINDTDTSITLASAASFPTPGGGSYFYATLIGLNVNGQENAWEIVKCTAKASNTLTVVRAQEGTTAASWGVGIRLELRLTALFVASVDAHMGAGGAAHSDAVAAGAAGFMTGTDKTKLDGIAAGAEVNMNADWNASSGDAQILNKPTLGTAAAAATTDFDAAGTAAALVVGLWDDRGSFDASVNTYPAAGGSGTAGAILKGDIWTISVVATSGVLLGYAVGTNVRAVVDTPGQTGANWAVTEVGLGYVPENAANKDGSGGYPGLTLFKLNLRNAANTITSWFTNAATVARTWTLPDKDGTVAMTSDLSTAANPTGTITGAAVNGTATTYMRSDAATALGTINTLLDISGASAGQIKFPATQNASADANTLDDYEKGTWTPSLGGTATYDIQTGVYTKIGRVVHVNAQLRSNSIGTGSTSTVSGLPFASANDGTTASGSVAYFDTLAVSVIGIVPFTDANTSVLQFYTMAVAGAASVGPSGIFQTNARIQFSNTYHV